MIYRWKCSKTFVKNIFAIFVKTMFPADLDADESVAAFSLRLPAGKLLPMSKEQLSHMKKIVHLVRARGTTTNAEGCPNDDK